MKVEQIETAIEGLRNELTTHPLYSKLESIEDIQQFMEYHVFAVWDFMSLLKALQIQLTCTTLPWIPREDASLARFINEIVREEESDVNELGEPKSHFEMYLEAMQQVGASTSQMVQFIQHLQNGHSIESASKKADVHSEIGKFINYTFEVINNGKAHEIAAAFTFGREDLIPDMFLKIIEGAERHDKTVSYDKLSYYLNRHIELDGDDHGPLALKMITQLCGDDAQKWEEVIDVSKAALQHRIWLWNATAKAIEVNKMEMV